MIGKHSCHHTVLQAPSSHSRVGGGVHLGKWLLPRLLGKVCSFCKVGFRTAWPAAAHLFLFTSGEEESWSRGGGWGEPGLPGARSMGRTKPVPSAGTVSQHTTQHTKTPQQCRAWHTLPDVDTSVILRAFHKKQHESLSSERLMTLPNVFGKRHTISATAFSCNWPFM